MSTAPANIQILSTGQGYGIAIGLGFAFVIVMIGLTVLQNKFTSLDSFQSEEFNTASRSVKPGLVASGILSAWTHPGTFLTACTLTHKYGLAGLIWQMGNGGFQILFFALAAVKLKEIANNVHIFPALVKQKHGTPAHIIFTMCGLGCNIIIGTTLMAGGSATFNALTGVNIWAMYFIFPIVCTSYILVGGLRSTFINDYLHSIVLFVIVLIFCFEIYIVYPGIGSIDNLLERLQHAEEVFPAAKNFEGSYLTIHSKTALITNLSIFMSSFSTVWIDQAFWQRVIASGPTTTVQAYILGDWSWYGLPFSFATAIGLGCIAVESVPYLWAFTSKLSSAQANAGLTAPAAVTAIVGQHGSLMLLVLLFMATTSSTSAEIITASSVHKTYINKNATGPQLVRVSMYTLCGYALVIAGVSCLFHAVNASLTWLTTVAAVLVGSGAVPLILILLWDRTSTVAATWGAPIGFFGGLIAWLVTTWKLSGEVTVVTTLGTYNALAGDVAAIVISGVATVILTFVFPTIVEQPELTVAFFEEQHSVPVQTSEKKTSEVGNSLPRNDGNPDDIEASPDQIYEASEDLKQQIIVPRQGISDKDARIGFRNAFISLNIFAIIFLLQFTLYGTKTIFNKELFRFWVVASLMWGMTGACICVLLPLFESRVEMLHIVKAILGIKISK